MGIDKKPQLAIYFTVDPLLCTPIFGKTMSKNRFLLLLAMLHLADNSVATDDPKLQKIKPIIEHFRNRFRESYLPKEKVCIDESLILWKGRLGFCQYIFQPKGPDLASRVLKYASHTGYVWDFLVYTGATTNYTVDEG
jgi:hypothetical protein